MKVLYLTYDGLSDPLGQSQILPYLIACHGHDHDISIISFEKKEAYIKNGEEIQSLLKQKGIQWTALRYTKSPPVFSTIKDLFQLTKISREIIRERQIDVIHCRSYVTAFSAFVLKKELSIKVLFDIRGFWIDERVEGGLWNLNNPIYWSIYKFLKNKEHQWFNQADAVVCLTNKAKSYIQNKFRLVTPNNITVIPCCTDTTLFDPLKVQKTHHRTLKEELGIKDGEKVLGYVGSLGTWYMYHEMLQSFKQLLENGIAQKFLVITRDDSSDFKNKMTEYGIQPSDVIIVSASREEVPHYMSQMDLGIFYIRPTFSKMASSPTKLGEYLSMGIPIITNSGVGDLDDFFRTNHVGMCVDILTQDLNLTEVKSLLNLNSNEIRESALNNLSLRSGIESYLKVYSDLS